MALPDSPTKTPAGLPPKIDRLSDDQLINNFKQNPVGVARELIKNQPQLYRFWRLVEARSLQDQALVNAYDKAQKILAAAPIPQPQPTVQPTPEIPKYQEEIITTKPPTPKNNIDSGNAPAIQNWLNDVKNYVADAYAQESPSVHRAAAYSRNFTTSFLGRLAMYRSQLASFALEEAKQNMLCQALGPIGTLISTGYEKKLEWQMAWMKNPLNSNAIYYYLQSLPSRMAFELMYIPVKATFGILARGGAPFISKLTYTDWKHRDTKTGLQGITTEYVFTPLLKSTQNAQKLADKLDKIAGVPSDTSHYLLSDARDWNDSPYKRHIETTNALFGDALDNLKQASLSGNRTQISAARVKIKSLLKTHDLGIFKNILAKTARRLRLDPRRPKDPISYFLSLIGGAIWDFSLGLVLNIAKIAAVKVLNLVPGFQVLRAQLTKFFTSNNVLSTFTVSGQTLSSFVKGTLSPTTFSFGYVGYQVGGPVLGTITAGLGAFYNTGLKIAANPYFFNEFNTGWVQVYKKAYALGDQATINSEYLRGFQPRTLSKFADFLHTHWYARLPINGWVAADFLSPLMQRLYGWSPTTTHIVFTGADYLWQIKGPLFKTLGNLVSRLPFVQSLVTQMQFGIVFPLKNWWFNAVYKATAFQQSLVGAIPTQWKMRTWARFGQNFFNPGFFMGISLIETLTPALGGWAWIAGPVAGSVGWFAATNIAASIAGMDAGIFMSRINPWAYSGYILGTLAQIIFPGLPGWFNLATGVGFGIFGMGLHITFSAVAGALNTTVSALVTGLTGISISATATAMWGTVMAIGSVAIFTIFFGYTIYAGFWVPMQEKAEAGPESSNFAIRGECNEIAANRYRCCFNSSLTENVFNSRNFLLNEVDFRGAPDLSLDLTDPGKTTSASRQSTPLDYSTVGVTNDIDLLTSLQYAIFYDPNFPIISGKTASADLSIFLSTPTQTPENLFDLMARDQSIVYSLSPFFDILEKLAQEHDGTQQLADEYEAQLKILKEQEKFINDLIRELENNNLSGAISIAGTYSINNPLNNPCPDTTQNCPTEKQGLKNLYDSWTPMIESYIYTLEVYSNQTDPNLDSYLTQLQTESEALKQQTDSLPDIITSIKKGMTDEEAAKITDPEFNFLSYAQMSAEDKAFTEEILEKIFPDVFKRGSTFYLVPRGTRYQTCLEMDYSGPTGVEQEICSVISYEPSIWGAPTAFAKSCSSFTP